jgi:hypothetical protein
MITAAQCRAACPMYRAGSLEPCVACFQDPEGIEECLDRATDFESMLTQLNDGQDEP